MEPLNPDLRRAILERVPEASPAEIDEYETLLAERFAHDPGEPVPERDALLAVTEEVSRLQQLYEKLIVPLER